MVKCSFNSKYFDYENQNTKLFECDKDAHNSKLCIFHDPEYADQEKIIEQLSEKTKKASKNNEPLFCIGYNIPKIIVRESFSKPVYFTKSKFQIANFAKSKFEIADFSGSQFISANFSGAKFEEADFMAIKVKGKADFSGTTFSKKINFSESTIESADFTNSSLNNAHFIDTNFKNVDFNLAKIKSSDFFGINVEQKITFVGTHIRGTEFTNANFKKIANFTGANLEKTHFPQGNFNNLEMDHAVLKSVNFQGATIKRIANFASTEMEKVDFFKINFKKNANFTDAILKEVLFTESNFEGTTNFIKTVFKDGVRFKNCQLNEVKFSDVKFVGKTFFDNVVFKEQSKVFFDVDDLSKVSFKNTDLTKIRFSERVKWAGKDGFRIIDEELLENSTNNNELENVIAIYRNLRKNYEVRFRYEEADRFFAREAELKRRYEKSESSSGISDSEIMLTKFSSLLRENKDLKQKIEELKNRLEKSS